VARKSSFIYDLFDISDFINDIVFSKPKRVSIAISCGGRDGLAASAPCNVIFNVIFFNVIWNS
jgi:hypothetical protein